MGGLAAAETDVLAEVVRVGVGMKHVLERTIEVSMRAAVANKVAGVVSVAGRPRLVRHMDWISVHCSGLHGLMAVIVGAARSELEVGVPTCYRRSAATLGEK